MLISTVSENLAEYDSVKIYTVVISSLTIFTWNQGFFSKLCTSYCIGILIDSYTDRIPLYLVDKYLHYVFTYFHNLTQLFIIKFLIIPKEIKIDCVWT